MNGMPGQELMTAPDEGAFTQDYFEMEPEPAPQSTPQTPQTPVFVAAPPQPDSRLLEKDRYIAELNAQNAELRQSLQNVAMARVSTPATPQAPPTVDAETAWYNEIMGITPSTPQQPQQPQQTPQMQDPVAIARQAYQQMKQEEFNERSRVDRKVQSVIQRVQMENPDLAPYHSEILQNIGYTLKSVLETHKDDPRAITDALADTAYKNAIAQARMWQQQGRAPMQRGQQQMQQGYNPQYAQPMQQGYQPPVYTPQQYVGMPVQIPMTGQVPGPDAYATDPQATQFADNTYAQVQRTWQANQILSQQPGTPVGTPFRGPQGGQMMQVAPGPRQPQLQAYNRNYLDQTLDASVKERQAIQEMKKGYNYRIHQ